MVKKYITRKNIVFVFFCMLAILYLGRGWIRNSVAPSLVTKINGQSVDKAYENSVAPVKADLEKIGLDFVEELKTECTTGFYSWLRISLSCGRGIYHSDGVSGGFGKAITDESFATRWKNETPKIQKTMEELGWRVETGNRSEYQAYAANDKLEQLIDDSKDRVSLSFIKDEADITCEFYFTYYSLYLDVDSGSKSLSVIGISSFCVKGVDIFGGYHF